MRCITAEERDALLEASLPLPGGGDIEVLGEMSERRMALYGRLAAIGDVRDVAIDGDDFPLITPRGRLALACYAAVHSVLVGAP